MHATHSTSFLAPVGRFVLAGLLAGVGHTAAAQSPTVQRLSLGDAARLAASQTAGVQSAEFRVREAQARVTQSRSALLPQVEAIPRWTSTTINSASFGFNFPSQPGQPPLLNPNGQIIGPVKFFDFRGQASQALLDFGAVARIRAAKANVNAAAADIGTVAEQSAATAATAYVRAARADAALRARIADSTLAAELVTIANDQLTAGVGVGLDVTRAQSQLAFARAQLIAARNDRDRS